ncbi:MAG: hypothetical protein V3V15_04795 [Sphingorhabdus sp.]
MARLIRYLIVILWFCAMLPAAYAQDEGAGSDAEVAKHCDAATARLAALQAQEDVLWSDQTESAELIRTWSSPECVAHRRKGTFDVTSELQQAMLLLNKSGIDFDADIASETEQCKQSAAKKWQMETDSFRKQNSQEELFDTCLLNARQSLYAQGLVLLYNRDQTRTQEEYELAMSEHKEAVRLQKEKEAAEKAAYDAEVAANKAEYEKAMADWRRCKAGKREYCKKN